MIKNTASHNHIDCPNCGYHIDIDEVLHNKFAAEFAERNQQAERQLAEARRKLEAEVAQREVRLAEERQKLEMLQRDTSRLIEEKAAERIQQRERELEAERLQKMAQEREEFQRKLRLENEESERKMKAELEAQAQQIRKLKEVGLELDKLKREKEDLELDLKRKFEAEKHEAIRAERIRLEKEAQNQAQARIAEAEAEAQRRYAEKERQLQEKQEKEAADRKKKEQEHEILINQLKDQIEEMRRKADQGSMQIQGEVQETYIEDQLRSMFFNDLVEEVKKGERGGDCRWTIRNDRREVCGLVVIESKNTKAWNNAWLDKLRQDQLRDQAVLAIIVSRVLPDYIQGFGLHEGVWITDLAHFRLVIQPLRERVLAVASEAKRHEGKTDKMSRLYDYLTSNECFDHLQSVVRAIKSEYAQLAKERKVFEKVWKEREKRLDAAQTNLLQFVGSIKGIADTNLLPGLDLDALAEGDDETD